MILEQASLYMAIFLMINMAFGLVRVIKGPSMSDRIIATYLSGTIGCGVVICLSFYFKNVAYLDVALILVLLGAMTLIAFVNRHWIEENIKGEE